MRVFFHYHDRTPRLAHRRELRSNLAGIFKRERARLGQLDYVFCSDSFLLGINRQFLKHDDYTDIITFDLSDGESINGEVYISVDRVRENARTLGLRFSSEMTRVLIHGALHLCGYKDKKPADIQAMRKREDHYLRLFHVER